MAEIQKLQSAMLTYYTAQAQQPKLLKLVKSLNAIADNNCQLDHVAALLYQI